MNSMNIQEQAAILDEIINHYKKPEYKKIMDDYSYKKEASRAMCGDNITMYIKCDNNNIITEASFDGVGCSISQGCADMMCKRVVCLNKDDLKDLEFDLFDLEKSIISKSRYKCALLSLEAIKNI